MKLLFAADSALEAHMILDLLTQAGIEGRIDGEYLQGGVGELQPVGVVRVLVNEDDYPKAKQTLDSWEAQQISPPTETKRSATTQLAVIMLAFVAGVVLTLLFSRQPSPINGRDYNGDGILDEVYFYRANQLQRLERDRNYDQRSDVREQYNQHGLLVSADYDNDFDGRFETRHYYEAATLSHVAIDADQDGFVEQRKRYRAGVLYLEQFFNRPSQHPYKQIEYSPFSAVAEEFDSNGDGLLDSRYRFAR